MSDISKENMGQQTIVEISNHPSTLPNTLDAHQQPTMDSNNAKHNDICYNDTCKIATIFTSIYDVQ